VKTDGLLSLVQIGKSELPNQVILERLRPGHGIFPGRETIIFVPGGLRCQRTMNSIGVTFEIILPIDGTNFVRCLQLTGLFLLFNLFRLRFFLGCRFLQRRIFLQLLGNQALKIKVRELQQLDRLLQLRRHDKLLGESLE